MNEYPDQHWYPQRAIDAWSLGFSVVRLQEPRQGDPESGKAPVGKWKQFQSVRPTRTEAQAIFGQYGIITGAVSGIAVVDCDNEAAWRWVSENLAETPMRTRTGKGLHLYYRHPGVVIGNRAKLRKLALDVRADGGLVVGPGSLHWSGRRYKAEGNWSNIETLPVFDPSWLAEERKFDRPTIQASSADPVKRAASYIARIEGAVSGQSGHAVTMRVAGILIQRFGLSIDQALPLMILWNSTCSPKWTERELLHKLQDALKNLALKTEPIAKTIGG